MKTENPEKPTVKTESEPQTSEVIAPLETAGDSIMTFEEFVVDFEAKYEEKGLTLEAITEEEDPRIEEIAELDAKIFGQHKSLTAEEFKDVIKSGGIIIGIRSKEGVLVAEASLLMEVNTADGASQLEHELPEDVAYCDGAAVDVSMRGMGLQKHLLDAREAIAKEKGKKAIMASVRANNTPSIKSMTSKDYVIINQADEYYGPAPEKGPNTNERVVLLKILDTEAAGLDRLSTDDEEISYEEQGITQQEEVAERITDGATVISLEVHNSDEVDESYSSAVATLLRSGYVGVACTSIDVGDGNDPGGDAMTFVKISSMNPDFETAYSRRQEDLDKIFTDKPKISIGLKAA